MFKETNEGETHHQNDGCGEPAHNIMTNEALIAYIKPICEGYDMWTKEHGYSLPKEETFMAVKSIISTHIESARKDESALYTGKGNHKDFVCSNCGEVKKDNFMTAKRKEIPFFAISNNELKDKPPVGKTAICPKCKKKHKVEYGTDSKGQVSTIVGIVRCGKDAYLVAVDQKLL